MHFRAEHRIHNIDLPSYEALYFDEPFGEALCQHLKLRRTLVARQWRDGSLQRAVTVGPQRPIPKPVAKLIGADHIAYTEHIDYVMGTYAGRWHIVSPVLTDKITSAGTFAFRASGADVLRTVEGEVEVKIFGLGRLVERLIAADIDTSYAEAARFTDSYWQRQPPKAAI